MKRNPKMTGMNELKLEALKKLKQARNEGVSRLQQEKMVFKNFLNIGK